MEEKDVDNIDTEDTNEKKELNEPVKKKQNRQLLWAIILMCAVIAIIFLVPVVMKQLFNKFSYNNLDFTKTRTGKIDFFSTDIPLSENIPITGAFIKKDEIIGSFPLSLRNDPRKLEYISVDVPNNTVLFKGNVVYITMNADDAPCPQNVISVVTLSGFLMDFASFKVEGAITDKDYSIENKVPYITCNNSGGNTVIWIKEGDETSIKKTNPYCYELTYKNCEMMQVSEKFILTTLQGYMSYFEGGENLKRPLLPGKQEVYGLDLRENKTI